MTTVGFVSIGQTPRTDLTPAMIERLPPDLTVNEYGILDDFDSATTVEETLGRREGEPMFVAPMRDGTEVELDRTEVFERVDRLIDDVEDEVSLIGVQCTGHFPELTADVPVLKPTHLLRVWVSALVYEGALGVMIPSAAQVEQTAEKWNAEFDVVTTSASPYAEREAIIAGAREIGTDAELIVMDCMGYNEEMKTIVKDITDTPVLLPRSIFAKTIDELL